MKLREQPRGAFHALLPGFTSLEQIALPLPGAAVIANQRLFFSSELGGPVRGSQPRNQSWLFAQQPQGAGSSDVPTPKEAAEARPPGFAGSTPFPCAKSASEWRVQSPRDSERDKAPATCSGRGRISS